MTEQQTSKEWATRARFERIKAEMPEGIPGYSEFRFNQMHDALRELIDYCDALHERQLSNQRVPKDHGPQHKVVELVDLGGPVARIERVTYVPAKWTNLTLMVPRTEREPSGSLYITLNADQLKRFVETLKWPE